MKMPTWLECAIDWKVSIQLPRWATALVLLTLAGFVGYAILNFRPWGWKALLWGNVTFLVSRLSGRISRKSQ